MHSRATEICHCSIAAIRLRPPVMILGKKAVGFLIDWLVQCDQRRKIEFINFSCKNTHRCTACNWLSIKLIATFKRLMIAVDMRMIWKFIFQRCNFEVVNMEREFSAFDGTGGSLKGRIKQNARYSLLNARVRSGTYRYLAILKTMVMVTHKSEISPTGKRNYFTSTSQFRSKDRYVGVVALNLV
jgi:hypothetical protein